MSVQTRQTTQVVHFNGREYRRVRFADRAPGHGRPVFVTWAVREHHGPGWYTATKVCRRAA